MTVGLRPEHFAASDDRGSAQSTLAPVHLEVDVSEYIGSAQVLAARLGENGAGPAVSAAVEVGPDAEPLGSGPYAFDTSRIYLFDPATGAAI